MNKLRDRIPRIMAGLLLLLILWQIPKMIDLEPLTRLTVPMAALLAAAGLIGILAAGLWKKPCVALLLAALAWMGGTSLLRGTLFADLYTYVPAACAMLFCFTVPMHQTADGLRRLLRAVCLIWILWMTVLCGTALFAAFRGVHIRQTMDVRFIGINAGDDRLYIMDYCTNAGGNIILAILAASGLILCEKSRGLRILCGLCIAVMLPALALTDARTSFIGCGIGLGVMAACGVFHGLKRPGRALRLAAAMLCAAATAVIVYLGISRLTDLVGGFVPGYESALIPRALADGAVTHRTIGSGATLLTFREDVWRGLLAFLSHEPSALMTGAGPSGLMARVMPYVVSEQQVFDHPHCIYLQVLGAYGVPGLLIMAAFLLLFVRRAWRLLFSGSRERWSRLLPVPAIVLLVCETVECLTLGRVNGPVLILLFLSMGAVFAAGEAAGADGPVQE